MTLGGKNKVVGTYVIFFPVCHGLDLQVLTSLDLSSLGVYSTSLEILLTYFDLSCSLFMYSP